MARTHEPALDELPIGELRARHREEHLCLKCGHHVVCRMAAVLDPNLLVTVTRCLAFEPSDPGSPASLKRTPR